MRNKALIFLLTLITALLLTACHATVNINMKPDAEASEENGSEETETISTETETESDIYVDDAPSIDISGCDTFTQIVDKKLTDGMGYANEKIGDTDALLVCSWAYDNLDGNMAAIDAAVFVYKDGAPHEAGKVCCGGTAYPLAINDDNLYVGSNHWIYKYTIKDDTLVINEKAFVEYDSEGNPTYEGRFEELFGELSEAKVINFDVVSK